MRNKVFISLLGIILICILLVVFLFIFKYNKYAKFTIDRKYVSIFSSKDSEYIAMTTNKGITDIYNSGYKLVHSIKTGEVIDLSIYNNKMLYIKVDGTVWTCEVSDDYKNQKIASIKNAVSCSACASHYGVVTKDGKSYIWSDFPNEPIELKQINNAKKIVCSFKSTVILTTDGDVYLIEHNEQNNLTNSNATYKQILKDYKVEDISANSLSVIAISDSKKKILEYYLSNDTTNEYKLDNKIKEIKASFNHYSALTENGYVYIWKDLYSPSLDNMKYKSYPEKMKNINKVESIYPTNDDYTFALKDNKLYRICKKRSIFDTSK